MLLTSDQWRRAYPGAVVGMLVMRGVANRDGHEGLQAEKERIESALRERFAVADAMKSDPILQAYKAYYKRFDKTYHVAGQVESVALKGRCLPTVNALVDVMFMAELKNMLLTAGHDLAACAPPFTVEAATEGERFTTMRGEEKALRQEDMLIRDGQAIISCIIHGPDQRSRITPRTTDAVYFTYGPDGIGEERVRAHLRDIAGFIRIFAPEAGDGEMETVRA